MAYYKKNDKPPSAAFKTMLKAKGFATPPMAGRVVGTRGNSKPSAKHYATPDATNPDAINPDAINIGTPSAVSHNPISLIASYFEEQSWHFEQFNSNELLLDIAGEWCRYRFYFSFIPERQFFYVTARIELPLPANGKDHYSFLLQVSNEAMRVGHVDMCPETNKPVWRFLLPLRGANNITLGQLADVLEEALYECDKIYPAFQLFVWGGYKADEAVASVLFPVMGSA